jgi:DNA-binding transcriptional LysR family regulator
MPHRPYSLPALSQLSTFEAAARHLSFKRAAQELNVTPGAISHQVRALETDLGLAMFDRVHRGVELTEPGERLFRGLRGAFLDLSTLLDDLRGQAGRNGLTIGATTAMSSLWLMPAILRFWRSYPDIAINQVVSDTLDFAPPGPDLIISYGLYEAPGYRGLPLFRDTLVPVCAPALAKAHSPKTLQDLAAMPLIHLDAPDKRWTSWSRWFSDQGHKGGLRRGITVNNYTIALQAAQDGMGMVLGWRQLVHAFLSRGDLVAFDAFTTPAPTSFFLSRNLSSAQAEDAQALERWILDIPQMS